MDKTKDTFSLALLMSSYDGHTADVIAIKYNDGTGYYPTTYGRQSQAWVDDQNAKLGIDKPTAEAYSVCSLFGNWANFDNVLAILKDKMSGNEPS
jgi:hypothetical protein